MDDNFTAEKVIEFIRRKEGKAYNEGTWLVVEFSDTTVGNRGALRELICNQVQQECLESKFGRVYVVSPNDQGFCERVR